MEWDARNPVHFIGFGLLLGFEQGVLLSESLFLCVGVSRSPNDVFDISLLISLAVTMMVVGWLSVRVSFLARGGVSPMASALLIVGGLALFVLAVVHVWMPLVVVAGIMNGMGVGGLGLVWQDMLLAVQGPTRSIALGIAFLSLFLSTYALVALPSEVALVIAFLLPVVSALLLVRARLAGDGKQRVSQESSMGSCAHHRMVRRISDGGTSGSAWQVSNFLREALGAFFCLAAFVVVFGIVGQVAMNNPVGFGYASTLTTLAIGIAGVVFFCTAALFSRVINPVLIYKAMFPLALGVLFLLPFTGWENRVFINMFIAGGYFFVSFAFMLLLANMIERHSYNSYRVNGLARGLEVALSLAGVFVGAAVSHNDTYDFIQTVIIVFVCVYLLAMALLLLMNHEKQQSLHHVDRPDRIVVVKRVFESADEQINARCGACAREFSLTKREEEVLSYLVRGRSSVYISKTLTVSVNTVKGHIKNIYVKTGVHSKQDLIDLVDEE